MNEFFYETGGQTSGPVPEGELHSLYQQGRITSTTRVWHEGMDSWQGYGERFPEGPPKNDAETAAGELEADAAPESTRCAVSGRTGLKSDMVDFGGVHVLPEFRDEYVQRLQQGCAAPQAFTIAGCWPRIGAYLLDFIIVSLPLMVISFAIKKMQGSTAATLWEFHGGSLQLGIRASFLIIRGLYDVIMTGARGATLGKMACRIKVVQADGSPPTYFTALKRYLVKGGGFHLWEYLPSISALLVLMDAGQRRAIHDHLAKTRVVRA